MAEGKFAPGRGFGEGLFADGGEGVRALVEEVVQALIGSEADEHFGAPWNAKGLPRPNGYRNGLKDRELRTRMGTLKLRLPQARNGSFFPSCLERCQTSEQALAATLGEMVVKGISTRKVAQLAEENGFIESFNGRLRAECLNVEIFRSLAEAQGKLAAWRLDFNQHRPHSAIGQPAPMEFAAQSRSGPSPSAEEGRLAAGSVKGKSALDPAGLQPLMLRHENEGPPCAGELREATL